MPKRSSRKKRGKQDANTLAKLIVEEATEEEQAEKPEDTGKDPIAVELGRRGGLKGGKARAKNMTKKQRSEAARKAANARWKKDKKKKSK